MKEPDWWEIQGEQWKFQPEPARFVPGDKVVCIDDALTDELTGARSWWDRVGSPNNTLLAYPRLPDRGKLYVIRDVSCGRVFLVGVTAGRWGREEGFSEGRFMLLSEYRNEKERIRKEGFWAKMREMEAFEKEMDQFNRDGSLSARGRKQVENQKGGRQNKSRPSKTDSDPQEGEK